MAVGTNSGATRAQQVGGIEQGSDGIAMFYREGSGIRELHLIRGCYD